MKLCKMTLRRLRLPLTVPYRLSLGALEAFDTILAEVEDGNGGIGIGEATLLTGYTDETIQGSWQLACELAQLISGFESAEAKKAILAFHPQAPFTATALITAIEMLEGNPVLEIRQATPVPILGVVNAKQRMDEEIETLLAAGFDTLKVKVGFDVEHDLAHVAAIQRTVSGRARIRLDANQGYDREAACHFASSMDPAGIELFEQPCGSRDWESACAVAKVSTVPMMLDESIYGMDDITRAAELKAARFIKLKLMKMGSLAGLVEALQYIRDCGMEPVLGNGVACEPGCWMEACVAAKHVQTAGEMNGFLKPRQRLFKDPLEFRNGAIHLKPGFSPAIDSQAARRYVVAEARFEGKPI
jgi:L-alanine-DL-glutamate epimerase-like enolase superfamily enzyme